MLTVHRRIRVAGESGDVDWEGCVGRVAYQLFVIKGMTGDRRQSKRRRGAAGRERARLQLETGDRGRDSAVNTVTLVTTLLLFANSSEPRLLN